MSFQNLSEGKQFLVCAMLALIITLTLLLIDMI
mgnify:CR=1 FL=1